MSGHMAEAWEIAEQLSGAVDQEKILQDVPPEHPFWIGASYAVDPLVGVIYKLPLNDPRRYERGLAADMFDQVVRSILAGDLRGNRLADAIEALSRACTKDQWTKWYRPILEGQMDLRLPLVLYNKYAPTQVAAPPFSKPKPLTATATFTPPREFFFQPLYDNRCFWMIDSRTVRIEVRGYDENIVRLHDEKIEQALLSLGKDKPMDIVVIGYLADGLVVDDLVTREQFMHESSQFTLRQRLEAAVRLGLPLVQRSEILTPTQIDEFKKELRLIFEQKYRTALLRDLDGPYPFRMQHDWKLTAKSWLKEVSS